MQLTIRNVPASTKDALRRRAQSQGKSLNEVAKEALAEGLGLAGQPVKRRDVGMFAGSMLHDDAEFLRIVAQGDQVHPDDWK